MQKVTTRCATTEGVNSEVASPEATEPQVVSPLEMERRNLDGRRLFLVYLLWVTACTSALCGCVLCLNQEGQVLFKWKQDFLEDVDDSLSNWIASDNTPCLWNGVKCTEGSVTVLDFSLLPFCHLTGDIHTLTLSKFVNLTILNVGNTSLSGNFSEDIVNCSKLVYLNLSWTHIGGTFPPDFSKLQHLQVLDLSYDYFEGTVENSFDDLQELRVLRLVWNYFEGQMPDSILSLTKLEELALSHNNWNGTLPLGFFTIPNLKVLWLGSDLDVMDMVPWPNVSLREGLEDLRLHGVNFPPSLFPTGLLKLTKLKTLNLERCHIMGPIPSLESLTHLEELHLANNSLSGHILDMFGSMPNLTVLWLYSNQLTGLLPASLLECTRLRDIRVFDNGLSGDLAGLVKLRGSLTWLDFGSNNFSGEIPSNLGNLTLLTFLGLNFNNLSGQIPLIWGTLSLLTDLNLGSNDLSGQIPPILGSLSLLTSLDLSSNHLSGPILPQLANLERLSDIYLQRNQLTGQIPHDLGRNTLLQWVDLGHNLFEGPMPPYLCWGNNVSLKFLGLYENKLTGTIPETYGNCKNLSVLRLDGNQLEGPVPAGLWGGANLVRMQLSGNHLSGSMDASIKNAKSLSILLVQDNQFSGPIPVGIGQTNLVKFQANSNGFNGTLTPLLGNLSSLTQLVLGANLFHGAIPASLGNCSQLFQLDLFRNHLEGAIPDKLANLNKLSILDVSENDLTGSIPAGLFNMVNLQMLNVAFNNLSGVIPMEGNGVTFVTVNFTGNQHLCVEGSCGSNSSIQDLASKGGRKQAWMVLVGVFGAVAFVVFVLVFRSCIGRALQRDVLHSHEEESSWTLTSFHNKVYHKDEVTALVEENLIGAGGSGQVYKVTLSDEEIVAVKKLWNVQKEEGRCDHGFGTELKIVANIRHRHIVKLLCSCTKGDNNLLVYEYMPNGSLGDLLHGPNVNPIPWEMRYKIAMGAATGLEYLHHDCTLQILHRDVKSNNILVDLEYEAHLADFGIARMVDSAASLDLSSIAGSVGYIPPEYSFGMRVTEKIDIYSFGVVLLELVTGKRAVDPLEGMDGANLVQWVHNRVLTPKGLCEILDSKCGTSSQSEMLQVLQVGMLCTNYSPASRPSMREVVKMLGDVAPQLGMNIDCNKDLGGSLEFDIVVGSEPWI